MAVVAIDLGGTKLAAAIVSESGTTVARTERPLGARRGPEVGDLAAETARALVRQQSGTIAGLGMCVPGIYSPATGRVWAPNIPGWDDYPLRDELTAALGSELPVRLASDRACCILGEIWMGAARGCRDAIFLAVGTGIGAGIVSDGRILNGRHGIAGALGWMALERPYRDGYETWGCFEYAASGDGLARAARDAMRQGLIPDGYEGRLARADAITGRDVFEAFEEDDPVATHVIDHAVELWGMAAANLVSLFNPERIIFGGGVFGPAVSLLGRIRAEAERWAQPIAMAKVSLVPAKLGGDAALYGAAKLVLDR